MDLYWESVDHEKNFESLSQRFNLSSGNKFNAEYWSACYIASHPELFKLINDVNKLETPLGWFLENPDHPAFTSGSRALAQAGLNLWNGHDEFNFWYSWSVWDESYQQVFRQALSLRTKGKFVL